MEVLGFDWDDGNREKCESHGVNLDEVESVFRNVPGVYVNEKHQSNEERFHAVGQTPDGKYIYVVFTYRKKKEGLLLRPISARYMHKKEIEKYEKDTKA